MKRAYFAACGIFILSTFGADAQTKLWSWRAKITEGSRSFKAIAMNQDGSGAFVISESPSDYKTTAFKLVWINSQGRVVMSKLISTEPPYTAARLNWEIAFTGPRRLVATDGTKVMLYQMEGTEGRPAGVVYQQNAMIFGSSTFGGWIDHTVATYSVPGIPSKGTIGTPGWVPETPPHGMKTPDVLTAWRF